jgi:DNA-binding NarL/FixJ family response regulator
MTIRVLLADDEELVRFGLRTVLESAGMEVVGEAADGAEAVALAGELKPDVVLLDVRMPRVDGLAAARTILARPDPPKVAVLTTFHTDQYVVAALEAGAAGFLLKDARPEELLSAIRNVAAGDAVVAPSATRRLLAHVVRSLPGAPQDRHKELAGTLTAREIEVLQQIAAGATNAEISATLYMAEGTVKTHIGRLLAKLDCRDRVGLVLFAFESGLADPYARA